MSLARPTFSELVSGVAEEAVAEKRKIRVEKSSTTFFFKIIP